MADGNLLLLDGHSLAYRAFYALPEANFTTTTGQTTNAVFGFCSMLINSLRDEDPTHVAVAFDVSRKTFRTAQYEQYKANRESSPQSFSGQVELIHEVLDALSICSVEVPGFEADDIIATLAKQATQAGMSVSIISGDRDTLQLVNDSVTVLYPVRGVSVMARMTPAEVAAKYGITPAQYADFAALRGDPSDNLPSVPKVGEKTAVKWINQYGGLDALVANVDRVPGAVGQSLRDHLGQVLTNRSLTQLVDDVPLPITLEDTLRRPFDRAMAHAIFDVLQFQSLRDRLFEALPKQAATLEVASRPDVWLPTHEGFSSWLAQHGEPGPYGVCVLGRWSAGVGDPTAVGISAPDGSVIALDPVNVSPGDDEALARWFANPAIGKILHDANGPMLALAARGWPLAGLVGDTALSAYVLLPGQRSFDLADLVPRFLHRQLPAAAESGDQLSLDGVLEAEHVAHAGLLASFIRELQETLLSEVTQRGGADLLAEVELPLVCLLVRMEQAGIAVDLDLLGSLEAEFGASMERAAADAQEAVGIAFNPASPKQLQEILFGKLDLPKTKRIKTGYTTDADALAWLYRQSGHPVLEALLRYRDVSKLRQVVAGLIPLADSQHRIHTTFNQIVAATGRLSSTEPNLQNIPVRTAEGRRIRQCFVVGDGYEALMTADYSQIEMRIMAHLSADEGLIAAFLTGEDLHSTVASAVHGVDPAHVDPEVRRRIKAMSYGLAYGLSAYGLSQQLDVTPGEAQSLMDEYFKRFGGVRDYLAEVVNTARRTGYTETILGRRRYLPDLTSDNRQRREMAERMALNAPIQGSAADIIKVAMLSTDAALKSAGLRSRLLLQVHDELVLEVGPGELTATTELVRQAMGAAMELSVPLDVSIGVGRTWQDAAH